MIVIVPSVGTSKIPMFAKKKCVVNSQNVCPVVHLQTLECDKPNELILDAEYFVIIKQSSACKNTQKMQ